MVPKIGHSNYVTERSDGEPRPKPEGHPDLSDRWVGAGHLKVGDKLKQADGTLGEVRYVNTIAETRTMYNLEVEEAHTFFVGAQGWLVHNCAKKALVWKENPVTGILEPVLPQRPTKIGYVTPEGETRMAQMKDGDPNRNVGNLHDIIRDGKAFYDTDSGHIVYVKGNRAVVLTEDGGLITPFHNPQGNTANRIKSERWIPYK